MNEITIWFLLVGILLIFMVLGEEFFKKAAISSAMVYLAIGFGLGPPTSAHYALNLPWALAILLGGILAPTDPVLASAVQVEDENDQDRLRIGLTGEAGLNDGTAFPVVMLALTLLGLNWPDNPILHWFLVDVLWACIGGVSIGYGVGWLGSKAIIYVHPKKDDQPLIEDFTAIGLIALSYAT